MAGTSSSGRRKCESEAMKLEALELRRITLPLVAPFRTSFGTQTERDILLVRAMTPDSEGWAECVALSEPTYSPEYVDMAQHVVRHHLAPRLLAAGDITAAHVAGVLAAANTASTLADARPLARLDSFDLLLIEQPLPEDDVRGHAELSRLIRTPVCLDESIESARDAAEAIALGACAIVNIKPGRVGGYLEARRVHDVCVASGVPVWCGGMLATCIGRAANV